MSRARDLADRVLHNRTHEDTDGGRESILTFKGEQSGGEISTLAQIQASHDGTSDDEKADLIFKTNDGSDGASPTEAARIDSDQNLLVSKTSADAATAGFETRSSGYTAITRDGGQPLEVRRLTSDGQLVDFRKGSTSVGSIGVAPSDRFYIGNGDAGIRFLGDSDLVTPWKPDTNANSDNLLDLGNSTNRWKDFYLGGGVYLGGNVAANFLDDYEEGTWTPTSPTVTLTGSPSGHYTKIGRMVVYSCTFTFPSSSSGVQAMVDGLPFSDNGTGAGSFLRYTNHGSYYTVTISGNRLYFYDLGGSATSIASVDPRRFDLIGVLMTA